MEILLGHESGANLKRVWMNIYVFGEKIREMI